MSVLEVAPYTRSAPGLWLSIATEGSATVVAVRGEVDSATVATLVDVLVSVIADQSNDVIVDLALTDFIDTAAVRALARAAAFLAERDRRLLLRSPSRSARRVLTIHELVHLVEPSRSVPIR